MIASPATSSPRVTVLMPAYNAGAYLRLAVDSVLSQTFADFELLIMDDGSNDGSLATVEAGRDSRIHLVHHTDNLGLIATLNSGVALARGSYLARMDADDLCEPERLERQVDYLDGHPEVGVCSTWATFIDREGQEIGVLRTATGKCLQRLFWKPSPLVHAAIMVRRQLLLEHPYDPTYKDAEDYELLLRLYDVTLMYNLPETLYRIRRHGGNIRQSSATANSGAVIGPSLASSAMNGSVTMNSWRFRLSTSRCTRGAGSWLRCWRPGARA